MLPCGLPNHHAGNARWRYWSGSTLSDKPLHYVKVHSGRTPTKTGARPLSSAFLNPRHYALPWLRFGLTVIALFLAARLLRGATLAAAALAASQKAMPYQRGQFWICRFGKQAEGLCAALAACIAPPPAADFVTRALRMLELVGWTAAHRFLFADLRVHLLGWPAFLAPDGRVAALGPAAPPA